MINLKRIIFGVFSIVTVVALIAGVTYAYFTDKVEVSNTLASGKLDVELRGAYKDGITVALDTTQYFKGGMAPGVEIGPYEIAVYNKGWGLSTLPVKYGWTANITGGSHELYDMLNVKVREGNCDWIDDAWFDGSGYIYTGKLNAMPAHKETAMGPLDPNITRCTWFYFELDSTAGNTYQGLSSQFDLVLDATQTNNPGWTE